MKKIILLGLALALSACAANQSNSKEAQCARINSRIHAPAQMPGSAAGAYLNRFTQDMRADQYRQQARDIGC